MRRIAPRRASGFTLIEVLAVIFLTTILLGVALNYYVDLSKASTRASDLTRDGRRATSLMDRVARDLENTILVTKPPEVDPLAHPWIFRAEPFHSELGADRVKFVARSHRARRSDGPVSDRELVAYLLRPSEDGEGYELLRWSAPHVESEGLDIEFPAEDDPAALVLADGISDFGLLFLGEDGETTDRWDSTQLLESGELPVAVEIRVVMLSTAERNGGEPLLDDEVVPYTRQVLLPVRPLDLAVLLDPETYQGGGGAAGENGEAGSGDDASQTLAKCVDWSVQLSGSDPRIGNLNPSDVASLTALRAAAERLPIGPYRDLLNPQAIRPECQ